MNKNKFLESLRKKLSILEESEIDDIITEYDGYIEEKIAQGTSEEDAVKSMGNIDELARDLLSAYKVKDPNDKTRDGINSIVDSFINIFDRIISVFAHKSFNDIVKFIIEIVFIFIIIAICKIPFEIIESMGRGIFSSFGSYPSHVINVIWSFILEFAYLIFAVLLFIKIFESRYLDEEFVSVFHAEKKDNEEKITKEDKENNKKEGKGKKVYKEVKEDRHIKKEYHEHKNFGVIDALSKMCMFFIKFILLFVIFGVGCYLVGMAVTLGISIYLIIKGVFYFGIYLILIALFILGIVAFIFLFNFIFEHKSKTGLLLVTMLISFGILGIGTGICAMEFANTTIIYKDDVNSTKSDEFEFAMKDNLMLSQNVFYNGNIIVDETLDNTIKVVYSYNDKYMKITANPSISDSYGNYEILYPGYRVSEFKYSKEIFDKFVSDLKNKTIWAVPYGEVDIKVYVSSEVKAKLEENEKKYSRKYNYRDLEDICEILEDRNLALPEYCKVYSDY